MKLSLKVVEWIKVGIALLVPLYYCKMMTYSSGVSQFPLFLILLVMIGMNLFKSKREKADECAEKAMMMSNSICYKLALGYVALVILPASMNYGAELKNIGYFATFGLFGLMTARAGLFCWFDKTGVN